MEVVWHKLRGRTKTTASLHPRFVAFVWPILVVLIFLGPKIKKGKRIVTALLVIYLFKTDRYVAAIGLVVAIAATAGVCIRDCRRGQFSTLSGVLVTIWLLITLAAFVFEMWVTITNRLAS
jgi:hypothetical protein